MHEEIIMDKASSDNAAGNGSSLATVQCGKSQGSPSAKAAAAATATTSR